jgi:hypothetical protein
MDAVSMEELRLCQRYYSVGSKPAPASRVAQILIHKAHQATTPEQVEIRPLIGPTQTASFVLDEEAREHLDGLTRAYGPRIVKGAGRTIGDRRFRFTAAALLRYLITNKAREIEARLKSQAGVDEQGTQLDSESSDTDRITAA